MDKLIKEYNEVNNEIKSTEREVKRLEENEYIKRYFNLKKYNEYLYATKKEIYRKLKFKEYKECSHIVICSKIVTDYSVGRVKRYQSCIKCGLTNEVVSKVNHQLKLTTDETVMYDYIKSTSYNIEGINTEMCFDEDLSHEIYLKIKEQYPDSDDKFIAKMFFDEVVKIRTNTAEKKVKTLYFDKKTNL